MKILPRIMQQQPRSQGLFQAREKTLGTRLMQQTPHIKEKGCVYLSSIRFSSNNEN